MKYMEELRYKPVALFRCDDTTPLQDYSGYGRVATVEGTASTGLAVSADATYSQRFTNAGYGKFFAPVYQQGQEEKDFTLSVCVYPIIIGTGSHQQVLSHSGVYDGITIEGTTVHFSTAYVGTDMARCSYDFEFARKLHIVGVHQKTKNSLYVNGVLVDEVDITTEQQAAQFGLSEAAFYCGYSASDNQRCLVNNVAVYSHALHTEEAVSIYRSINRIAEGNVPAMFDGVEVLVDSSVREAPIERVWENEEAWQGGHQYGVAVDGDSIVANTSSNLTLSGAWIDSVDLYSGLEPLPLNSANLWWEGKNETVEVSVDGTTWVTAVRGQNLSIIPTNFDPTNKALYVRVSFVAGLDEAYVDYLRVRAYTSNTANSNGRTVTYSGPVTALDPQTPFEMRDDWGVRIDTGGSMTIGPDLSGTPMSVKTLEVWVKPDAATTGVGYGVTAINRYQNGKVATANLPGNEWVIYHTIFTAARTDTIVFNQVVGRIGRVAVYETALTAAEIAAIAANYTGVNKITQDLTGTVGVTEPSTSTVIYAADWEITAS